jgi:hypothetical protein
VEGVDEVRQLNDACLFRRVEFNGRVDEWFATITEQTPDHHIVWKSTSG